MVFTAEKPLPVIRIARSGSRYPTCVPQYETDSAHIPCIPPKQEKKKWIITHYPCLSLSPPPSAHAIPPPPTTMVSR